MYAAAILLGFVGNVPLAESTELVEVNHCYNPRTGERRFVQVIYWDRYESSRLHVREWHMYDERQQIHRVHERPDLPYTVLRPRDGNVQVIRAKRLKVTHTFVDPEEEDRKQLPVDARRPLGK